jgi:hypothetical protein
VHVAYGLLGFLQIGQQPRAALVISAARLSEADLGSFTCWLTMLADMLSRAAAPVKLALSTTLAKTRMLSKRSTGLSDY